MHEEEGDTIDPLTGKDVYREDDGTLWDKKTGRLVRHGGKYSSYPIRLVAIAKGTMVSADSFDSEDTPAPTV